MTLSLRFYVSIYVENKPVVHSTQDVHVIVEDGCYVVLDESDKSLTKAQIDNLRGIRHPSRKKFLFYMNKEFVDSWYFDEGGGRLELHCPTCGEDYIINKDEYDSAYRRFLEGDE